MKIKKGDTVKMLIGKDRGKTGKVLRVSPGDRRLVVEGVNLLSKHQRPKKEGEKGQKIQFPRAVPLSRVLLVCTKCAKGARVGWTMLEDGKKVRTCKKCKQLID